MEVIIFGKNRVEVCKVPPKQYERHFYLTRDQLYKCYPDGLTRMRRTKYGHAAGDEEIICYKENAIVPYNIQKQEYSMDKILSEIDEHKLMTVGKNKASRLSIKNVASTWKKLSPMLPFIITGFILLWALVLS